MSDIELPMTLPLDSDGFLRRECPKCEREFKWLSTDLDVAGDPADTGRTSYRCPYCGEAAECGQWFTKPQLEYAKALVMAEHVGPQVRDLQRQLESINRRGGLIRIDLEATGFEYPEKLHEPDDMVRVDFPCHPEEPLKVDEAWAGEVGCLVCGIRYPVELVLQG